MQTNHTSPSTHQPQQIDKVLLLHEAAAFLGLTEEQLMTATLQGNCPGACIDGHWRFSQRGLSKYLRCTHNSELSSLRKSGLRGQLPEMLIPSS